MRAVGAVVLLLLSGCATQNPIPAEDTESQPKPESWGWSRNLTTFPALHLGDTFWLDYDFEWHGSRVERVVFRVHEAPGAFRDELGNEFTPPAIIEEVRPVDRWQQLWVLAPTGSILAGIGFEWDDWEQSAESRIAWGYENGDYGYSGYGRAQNLERALLPLMVSGKTLDSSFESLYAYGIPYEAYAWSNGSTSFLGLHTSTMEKGNPDRNVADFYVRYEFQQAAVAQSSAFENRQSGKFDDPKRINQLTRFEPGDGPAVTFSGTQDALSVPAERIEPGPRIEVPESIGRLSYQDAVAALEDDERYSDWAELQTRIVAVNARYNHESHYVGESEARPHWWLRQESPDSTFTARVSKHSETEETGIWPVKNTTTRTWLVVDEIGLFDKPEKGFGLFPSYWNITEAMELAKLWAEDDAVVERISVNINDFSGIYRTHASWHEDLYEGSAAVCFVFSDSMQRDRQPEQDEGGRFGVTNVSVNLVTGEVGGVSQDADASQCH